MNHLLLVLCLCFSFSAFGKNKITMKDLKPEKADLESLSRSPASLPSIEESNEQSDTLIKNPVIKVKVAPDCRSQFGSTGGPDQETNSVQVDQTCI